MNGTMQAPVRSLGSGRRATLLAAAALLIGAAAWLASPAAPPSAAPAKQPKDDGAAAAKNAVAAANAYLESLDPKQRELAVLVFESEKKPNWSNLPVTFVPRNGMKLGDLSEEQRKKAMGVVAAVLSKEGYQKVVDIMDGDQKLVADQGKGKGGKGKGAKGKGGDRGPMFGKDLYYLAIFGTPSETKPWMVQFGGHHLGVNITIVGKDFVLTPSHTGAQPALFKRGEVDVRPLGRECDAAYKLMDSLDEKQRKLAVVGDRPHEMELGPGRDGRKLEQKGIKGADLSEAQQSMLLEVVAAWVSVLEPEAAAARMAAIKGSIRDTSFAWSGPTEKGKAAYFRVQGPTVVIEYAPQQGGTSHIHTVYRDPTNDYGRAFIHQ